MKLFSERNPVIIGLVGVAVLAAILLGALNYRSLPIFNQNRHFTAYFADASGLTSGAAVEVSGLKLGHVNSLSLDGAKVVVLFDVNKSVHLGERTEARIKTKSVLGAKVLEILPRGEGTLSGAIPLERTTSAYQLPDALGDVSAAISGLNTDQLSQSLATLSGSFKDTPPQISAAVAGVGRFSDALDKRDEQLRNLLAAANKTTSVLAERSDEVVQLIADTNALLAALKSQGDALEQISSNLSAVSKQIKGLIADNRQTLQPALEKLNGALTIVDNRKTEIQQSIKKLNAYAMSLGESVSSGPFFKAYLANLLPGQFVQPFVDAAFSDLGLDPHTLLPSQLNDPQVGQPGTPALPVPYPRTGQGGEPHLNLPDAITGNPGDPRYPYREPAPAPPPGGPPPGPPAPGLGQNPSPPAPDTVFVPAPGEVASGQLAPGAVSQPQAGPDGNR